MRKEGLPLVPLLNHSPSGFGAKIRTRYTVRLFTHLKVRKVIETDVVICDEDWFPGIAGPGHKDGPPGRLNGLFCRRLLGTRPVEVDKDPIRRPAPFHAPTHIARGRGAAAVAVGPPRPPDGPSQERASARVEAGA